MTAVDTGRHMGYRARTTLCASAEEYLDTRDVGLDSLKMYRVSIKKLVDHVDPEAMTHADALAWRKSMADAGLSPATVAKHVRHASMFLAWLGRVGRRDGLNPFDGVRKSAKPPAKTRYVTAEEVDRILHQCPSASWRNAFALARFAALRLNEIRGLQAKHVDMERRLLLIRPSEHTTKKSSRDVPITPALAERLIHREWADPCGGLPKLIYQKSCKYSTSSIIAAAGVEAYPKPFHALRGSCERDWNDAGFSVMTVCRWMGHSPSVAYMHYLDPTPAEVARATGQEEPRP